jgi:NAD-dependent SIR2 family protein deacetylase
VSAVRNKRRGLQPARCHGCEAVVYLTWSQAERHGMPLCAGCGAPFQPDDLELASALCIHDAAAVVQYESELARIERGRQSGAHKFGEEMRRDTAKSRDGRLSIEELAAERVERDRRERARAARLNALRPSIVRTDPIPF